MVCNWHPGHMGSVAHGEKPSVWFATAYQTSYDRHEGCWTAGLEVRTATEADAMAMCERMLCMVDDAYALESIIADLCDERHAMRGLCRRLDADVQMWRARAYEGAE